MKVGIIGCGHHANNHAIIVQESSFADLVAVADLNAERAKTFADKYGVKSSYDSLSNMLDQQKLDLLIIVAFPSVHPAIIKEALDHGTRNILCEKPIALNASQVEEIQALAAQKGALVIEGLMYRSHPQIMKTRELISAGAIGEVKTIHGQFSSGASNNPDNWRNNKGLGGGSMAAKGCYLVDACNLFSGSRAKTVVCLETIHPEFTVEIGETGMIRYENGVTAQFETNHRSSWREEIKVCGTEGTIVIPNAIVTKGQQRRIELIHKDHSVETIEFEPCNSYALQFENIFNCIQNGVSPTFPIEDSIVNYKVTDALKRSVDSEKLEEVIW